LYLDAWAARFDSPSQATEKWVELARLYPDYAQAQMNAAMWLFAENRYGEALAYGNNALKSHNALQAIAYDTIGRAQMGLGKYPEAEKAFDKAIADGYRSSLRRRLGVAAAARKFAEASALEKKLASGDRYSSFERASLAVDQARWLDAVKYSGAALASAESAGGFDSRNFPVPAATAEWIAGNPDRARAKAQLAADRALQALGDTNDPDAEDDAAVALASSLLALRLGSGDQAKRTLAALEGRAKLMKAPGLNELRTVVRAELLRISGQPRDSIQLLQSFVNGNELYQTRSALLNAYRDAKNLSSALDQARWLQKNRGRAYTEQTCGYCTQLLNVADSNLATLSEAEILEALGRDPEAAKALEDFDRRWPVEVLPTHLRVRRSKVSASSVGVL
jgi:tetratricopeptide (TPR) repeat protein